MSDRELAWHFCALGQGGSPVLRDGRPLAIGRWLEHAGVVRLCESGLHASTQALHATGYAPGPFVTLCEVEGISKEDRHDDKLVARRRRPLWGYDASAELRLFARQCALSVIDNWQGDVPTVVRQYLETGDESLGSAAASAWSAAASAARSAAYAARSAAWSTSAARSAAWSAAWSTSALWSAWSAADSAASAADSAAWSAALDEFSAELESILIGGAIARGLWSL